MGEIQRKKEELIEKIGEEMERNGGLLKTSQLYELHVDYHKIQKFMEEGILERVKNGYYGMGFSQKSQETMITELFQDGVLCLESALFYQGYSEVRPAYWHISIDKNTSKSRFKLKYPPVRPYYVEPPVLTLGVEGIVLGEGTMKIQNKERLICDCLKFEEKLERDVFHRAILMYISEPHKDIQKLMEYARIRRVTQKVQNRIGVWL
ncbi:MAG: hypothetical protein RR139_08570 [Lachnospiraceae bacterium]